MGLWDRERSYHKIMTGQTFTAYIRRQTKTNTATFPDADLVTFVNIAKDELAGEIVANVDEGYFDVEMVRSLEADTRDYTFTNDILKHIKYASAKLDGTKPEYLREADYSMAEVQNMPMLENDVVKAMYSGKKPEFLVTGRGVTILSANDIIDVVEGLKVVAEVYPEDLDSTRLNSTDDLSVPTTDVTHAMPRASHLLWATRVISMFKSSKEKPIPLTQSEQVILTTTEEVFKMLNKRNVVRSFTAAVPENDGSTY